jgi:hypothetical protein
MKDLPSGKYRVAVILWAALGFVIGTAIMTPLILSADRYSQLGGGIVFGGIPGALIGWRLGRIPPPATH